jgi:hypothetical protein
MPYRHPTVQSESQEHLPGLPLDDASTLVEERPIAASHVNSDDEFTTDTESGIQTPPDISGTPRDNEAGSDARSDIGSDVDVESDVQPSMRTRQPITDEEWVATRDGLISQMEDHLVNVTHGFREWITMQNRDDTASQVRASESWQQLKTDIIERFSRVESIMRIQIDQGHTYSFCGRSGCSGMDGGGDIQSDLNGFVVADGHMVVLFPLEEGVQPAEDDGCRGRKPFRLQEKVTIPSDI